MANPAYHYLYNNTRWRKKRRAQLNEYPLCEMCLELDRTTIATVADHVIPHRGNEHLFWNGKLQSLCADCHNGPKASFEATGKMRGCDVNGQPLRPNAW
jgi:5-methylcytosine-specific restriction endonuclease McrA